MQCVFVRVYYDYDYVLLPHNIVEKRIRRKRENMVYHFWIMFHNVTNISPPKLSVDFYKWMFLCLVSMANA